MTHLQKNLPTAHPSNSVPFSLTRTWNTGALCFMDHWRLAILRSLILPGFGDTERNRQNCLLGHKSNLVCLLQTKPRSAAKPLCSHACVCALNDLLSLCIYECVCVCVCVKGELGWGSAPPLWLGASVSTTLQCDAKHSQCQSYHTFSDSPCSH